jgi:hypothetical protein
MTNRRIVTLIPLALLAAACSELPTGAPPVGMQATAASSAHSVAPTTWSAAGPGAVTLVNDGSSANPEMNYALSGSVVWSTQTWSFSTTAATTGAITEDYVYRGYHAFFQVRVFVRPFIIHNSVKTYVAGAVSQGPVNCCTPPSGGFHITGSTTFNVSAGDIYGYEFGGSNFDSDSRLLGTFTIVYPLPPADVTPPEIQSSVTGTLGNNGWYTSDVDVSWTVTDDESPVTSTTGCGPSTLATDTDGAGYTCSATSGGGSASETVTVKRDATAPSVSLVGNAGSYTVDEHVNITCSASDATSGLAGACTGGTAGAAYTFALGANAVSASATDNAGNTGSASGTFTVSVTSGSLCNLVRLWVSQKGVANSMCQQLANGAYGAFRNHVRAQSGKFVSAAHATMLISLSNSL